MIKLKVEGYKQISVKVEMDWNAVIDNDGPDEEDTIIETIMGIRLKPTNRYGKLEA